MAAALMELSVRCRPPHRQTAGRRQENESHPGGILPTGHLPKGHLPRGHSGDGPLEGSSCRPKGRTGTAAHVQGERVCEGPVGGGAVQGTAGWAPSLEGQAAPTLWVGHGSWVTGRGSQRGALSLLCEPWEPWESCRQGRDRFRLACWVL